MPRLRFAANSAEDLVVAASEMVPRRKRRRVVDRRQKPLLKTHYSLTPQTEVAAFQGARSWSILPTLVLLKVFSLLRSEKDKCNAVLVCRHWASFRNDPRLWLDSEMYVRVCRPFPLSVADWRVLQARRVPRLNLGFVHPSAIPRVGKKISQALPALRSLTLEIKKYKQNPRYDLSPFTMLRCLVKLVIVGSSIPISLPSFPSLKELHLLKGVKPVFEGGCETLDVLTVESFQDASLPLELFPNLQTLHLRKTPLSARVFFREGKRGEAFELIQTLDLAYSSPPSGVKTFFSLFPNLVKLDISLCRFSEFELKCILEQLILLRELIVTGNAVTDEVLSCAPPLLTTLEMRLTSGVTVRGMQELSLRTASSLTSLSLYPSIECCSHSHSLLVQLGAWFPQLFTLRLSGWELPVDVQRKLSRNSYTLIM